MLHHLGDPPLTVQQAADILLHDPDPEKTMEHLHRFSYFSPFVAKLLTVAEMNHWPRERIFSSLALLLAAREREMTQQLLDLANWTPTAAFLKDK